MVRIFNRDPGVVAVGSEYLRIISWNFVASGVVFVSSSVFQGIGNTLPSLASSCLRLLLFALPTYLMAQRPGFELKQVWYLSVTAVAIQLVVNLLLLHREFRVKLPADRTARSPTAAESELARRRRSRRGRPAGGELLHGGEGLRRQQHLARQVLLVLQPALQQLDRGSGVRRRHDRGRELALAHELLPALGSPSQPVIGTPSRSGLRPRARCARRPPSSRSGSRPRQAGTPAPS